MWGRSKELVWVDFMWDYGQMAKGREDELWLRYTQCDTGIDLKQWGGWLIKSGYIETLLGDHG